VAVQSGSAGLLGRLMADLHHTLRAVFPRVVAYTAFVTSFMDLYGFHVAGKEDFDWLSAPQIAACLAGRDLTGLGWFAPEFGACLPRLPLHLENRLANEGRVLTDAAPYRPRPGERPVY